MFDPMGGMGGNGFTSVQTFSGTMGQPGGGFGMGMHSSSTSTRFVNGKKVTTKKKAIKINNTNVLTNISSFLGL